MFTQRFSEDFEAIIKTDEPFALVRFGDGEHAILDGLNWSAASGWKIYGGQCWLREDLKKALSPSLDRFGVGVSPPCCMPRATYFYRHTALVSKSWQTFATIFSFQNYGKFKRVRERFPNAVTVAPTGGDFHVPKSGILKPWDIDSLVSDLLDVDRPIFVAAGPCANVIIHRYWERQSPDKRQTILDVGTAIDQAVHGEPTRYYNQNQHTQHVCSWDTWSSYRPVSAKEREQAQRSLREAEHFKNTTVVQANFSISSGIFAQRQRIDTQAMRKSKIGALSSGVRISSGSVKKTYGRTTTSSAPSASVRVVQKQRSIQLKKPPKKVAKPLVSEKIKVVVLSYNRPEHLIRLLKDVVKNTRQHKVEICVYDDASTADYTQAKAVMKTLGVKYVRSEMNHGKKLFWKWVSRIYQEQKQDPHELFVLLPDDVRLCSDFFNQAIRVWNSVSDEKKVALNLLRDTGRDTGACWTSIKSKDVGSIFQQGWVDGAILCNREYFKALDWSVPATPASRWDKNPTLSSGVGQSLSRKLIASHKTIYGVKKSLLVHVEGPSTMNPEARRQNPLSAVAFIDGEISHTILRKGETVTISLASVPRRKRMLQKTIESLYAQCDKINVYLNGYSDVPSFLKRPFIEVARSQDHGDLGDAGKFFWSDKVRGYHLTVDDDIVYPYNYTRTLLSKIEQYKRRKVVGVHGVLLPTKIGPTYYTHRKVYRCLGALKGDKPVHILGTGTVAYHTETVKITPKAFKTGNMADIWFGIAVKAQKGLNAMVCVAHKKDWLVNLPDPEPKKTIFEQQVNRDKRQVQELRKYEPWNPPIL